MKLQISVDVYTFFFQKKMFFLTERLLIKISFQDILYVITNFLTVMISFVKIIIIMIYKKEFIDMILYMEKNFWNVKYDFQEEEILNNCRKTCIFFVTSVSTIGICAMISYAITPIIGEQNEISIIFFLKFANFKRKFTRLIIRCITLLLREDMIRIQRNNNCCIFSRILYGKPVRKNTAVSRMAKFADYISDTLLRNTFCCRGISNFLLLLILISDTKFSIIYKFVESTFER